MHSHLINYAKWLVWQYYQTEWNRKLVIRLKWAPWVPERPTKEAETLSKVGFDFIAPDYYGHGRSSGYFNTKNCIQTAYDTLQTFRQQIPVVSVYSPDELLLPVYEEIVIVGGSYGWWIAAAMPKFDDQLKEVVLLYPALDRLDRNEHGHPESTDEDFLREYLLWYKNIYRVEEWSDPYDAMLDIEPLFSLSKLWHLSETKVFVWHGSADNVIWCGRSRQFIDDLRQMNPDWNYHYAEYYGLWHGGLCKDATLQWWLYRRKQFEVQE